MVPGSVRRSIMVTERLSIGIAIPQRVSVPAITCSPEGWPLTTAQFEENNRAIAEIGKVQALVLVQDVGLWSGNRRKMEIAECRKTITCRQLLTCC